MHHTFRAMVLAVAAVVALNCTATPAHAASAAKLNKEATAALKQLCAANPTAKLLGEHAKAVLIFPSIWKAGFIFGGQGGNGVLRKGGKRSCSRSWRRCSASSARRGASPRIRMVKTDGHPLRVKSMGGQERTGRSREGGTSRSTQLPWRALSDGG